MADEVRVRTLNRADVPWAIALTDTEAWGYTPEDFERLLFLEPEGVLVAEAGGERAGVLAIVTWGPLAYLGAVIVDAAWRGKHVGEALMKEALDLADRRGVESVRLNAYLHVVPFYERLGFRREFENVRFGGASEGWGVPGVRLMRADDLAAIEDLDRRYFGADRARLLGRLLEEFPGTSYVLDDGGEIVAFAFGNASAESCEIGPFVGPPERAADAESLLNAILGLVGTPCALSVPSTNEKGLDAAKRAGLRETFKTFRMVRGSAAHGGDPRGIFALAGLEKG
jgi:ribosomal protein S18 acetylase RimI-like enzyme